MNRGSGNLTLGARLRIGAATTVVADAASVGSDAGSIRHDGTVIAAPALMSEVSATGEDHGDAELVARRNHFVIAFGAAGLNDGLDSR